jgi:hypothetical protein
MTLTLGINVIKLFLFVANATGKKARALDPCKPFQPYKIFVGKTRSLPKSITFWVGSGLTCKY